MPLLVQLIGVGLIIYEAVLAHPVNTTVIAAGLTMAAGGKLSDIIKRGGL